MEPGSMKRRQASGTQRMEPACATVLFLILTLVVHHGVLSEFTNEPSDSEHLVNETTYFNCSSSITSKEIHWFHYPVGVEAHERKSVYAFGKFIKDFKEDFAIEKNTSSGTSNLVIRSVKPNYAGKYECQEDGGFGNSASAELIVLANAFLTVTPRDTESKVNDTTYFNCSTNITSKEIRWSHGGGYVYAGGTFYFPYLERFMVEINTFTGAYNLVIVGVQPEDVGEYSCQDDEGHGKQSATANLIVLANEPTCHSNFIRSGNNCGIDPDEVQLSCSVGYHGNIPPQLEWRKAGENSPIGNTTSIESGSRITHSVTLKTDLSMNGQSYVCQTTRSATSQYKCSSETIRLQYVFAGDERVNTTIDKEVKCFANSSQPCNYKWISESDSLTVSTEQTLKPTRLGSHRCEATCYVGNTSCTVVVMFVEVLPAATTKGSETTDGNSSVFVGVVVGVILSIPLVVAMVIVGIFLYIRRRRNSKQKGDVETIKTEPSTTPLMALTAEDDNQVKQSDPEPNKDGFGANKADLPLTALNAEAEKNVKPSDAKRNKVLSLLEGKPELVSKIKRGSDRRKPITGVTVLKDKLFVAAENSSVLEVSIQHLLVPVMV